MSPASQTPGRRTPLLGAAVILAFVTVSVFWPVGRHPFIAWDDGAYVFENDVVRGGLTAAGVRWAFTSFELGNWHPLTWLSHLLDVELWGMNAGAHHLSSLGIHLAAAILLLTVLHRFTGRLWRSAMVSLLFAVHPLHVESVAWVSERKDVLAALFWVLTMAAYLRYVRKPGAGRYGVVVVVYLLGLMAKPMLVTVPFVLLLLDYWPLGRLGGGRRSEASGPRTGTVVPWRLVLEKAPLLVPALAAAIAAWVAQTTHAKATVVLELIPFPQRVANAAVSYAIYLMDTALPRRQAFFYPYPIDGHSPWAIGGACFLLAALSVVALLQARRRPYLLMGWGWFLVTLLPVIGLVQVGAQARADRYTYLPLVGVFTATVWAGSGLGRRWRRGGAARLVAGTLITVVCAVLARRQAGYWRDTEVLARRAVAVTADNWIADVKLGAYLCEQGRAEEGLRFYRKASEKVPRRAERHFRRGALLAGQGDYRGAAAEYLLATRIYPPYAMANFNLGLLESRLGDDENAAAHFRAAIAFRPDFVEAYFERGVVLARQGYWEEAAATFAEALKYRPGHPEARHNLQTVLEGLGYGPGSVEEFIRSQPVRPGAEGATGR